MALIMTCGLPAAGISTRANELADYFRSRIGDKGVVYNQVHVINDESLGIVKNDYLDRESEKRARGKQMAAVKRLLGPKSVVILDNMTYIKGFRYQLFCEAKAAQVNSCVVYVGTPADRAAQFNAGTTHPWSQSLFDALVFRFEEPNGMARWDSPLFIVTNEDKTPLEEIFDSLVNSKPLKPNAATLKQASVGADYLSTLNETTSQIVKEALQLYSINPGGTVILRNHKTTLPYSLMLSQLTRIRRNFISLNKQSAMPIENIEEFFIQFLEKNWNITN